MVINSENVKQLGFTLIGQSLMLDMHKGGFLYAAGEQLANGTAPTGDVCLMALGELIEIIKDNPGQIEHDAASNAALRLLSLLSSPVVTID